MQRTRLRSVWEEGGGAVNFWLSMGSSVSTEIACGHEFDSLTIDLQHGLSDYATALSMLQTMRRADATAMARVPSLESGIIMKLLDAGAMDSFVRW